MSSKWPSETQFREVILKVEDNVCKICGSKLIIRSKRIHRIERKEGRKDQSNLFVSYLVVQIGNVMVEQL
jgi:hypothetical protein